MEPKHGAQKSSEMHQPGGPPAETEQPSVQPQIQDHIGRQLRAIYEELLSQPVPDRFAELLEKLDRKAGDEG
jgi:hypothetical protein